MEILMYGPPCSGKSTIAKELTTQVGVNYISVGTITRREISKGTNLGREIKRLNESKEGQPYPPKLLYSKLYEAISQSSNGFILDGYPKHPGEVPEVKEMMDRLSIKFTGMVHIKLGLEEAIERANGRLWCPLCDSIFHETHLIPKVEGLCNNCTSQLTQRSDDTPEKVTARYRRYLELTVPAIEMMTEYNDGYYIEVENSNLKSTVQTILNADNLPNRYNLNRFSI